MQPTITNNPNYLHPEFSKILQNVAKRVSKPLGFDKPYSEAKTKNEVEYASSLVLQILIYFNVYYFFCWFLGNCFLWPVTISGSDITYAILVLFAFIIMAIFEAIRLYLAYIGNLCERVPELTGFWLLTLIIELPLCIFFLIIVWFMPVMIPMQFSLEIFHAIFVFLEIIFGYIALRILARYQISRFHYKQFQMPDPDEDPNSARYDWMRQTNDNFDNLSTKKVSPNDKFE